MLILLPVLIVLLVALLATGGLALHSRPGRGVVREPLPPARLWQELDFTQAPEPPQEHVEFLADSEEFSLTQNSEGTDLSLNDLMYYKLNLHYSANNSMSLNDLLVRFRADNP